MRHFRNMIDASIADRMTTRNLPAWDAFFARITNINIRLKNLTKGAPNGRKQAARS